MCEYFSNEISSSFHYICFLKLRFTQRKAEQPLKDMGLQEKEEKRGNARRKAVYKVPKDKRWLLTIDLDYRLKENITQAKNPRA